MCSRMMVTAVSTLLLVQYITAQCIPDLSSQCPVTLAYAPDLSSGGPLAVRSESPIVPTGVAVLADQLVIEGPLIIDGELPFLGTVVLEGMLPSAGIGAVTHSCGRRVGISSELVPTPVRSPLGLPAFDLSRVQAPPVKVPAPPAKVGAPPVKVGASRAKLGPSSLWQGASSLGLKAPRVGPPRLGPGRRLPGCARIY